MCLFPCMVFQKKKRGHSPGLSDLRSDKEGKAPGESAKSASTVTVTPLRCRDSIVSNYFLMNSCSFCC